MAKRAKHGGRIVLGDNSYGKSRVRMLKVTRRGKVHHIREIEVAIALTGDFEAIHCRGDNRKCLPTDTMKNTVYALGKDHPIGTIEEFAIDLGRRFVRENRQVEAARIQIREIGWKRVKSRGQDHPHCFLKCSEELRTCDATTTRKSTDLTAGLENLVLLKSADSAFSGYPKDRFTTLAETRDRILCTSVTATWNYTSRRGRNAFAPCREAIRESFIQSFAAHQSESVQQTLFAMGEAALQACRAIDRIHLSMPNKHYLLANLAPFGMDNRNEVFVPTDEPYGLIEATVERA